MTRYLLVHAETRETVSDYDAAEGHVLRARSQIPPKLPQGTAPKWEVLAVVEGEDMSVALVRPAPETQQAD